MEMTELEGAAARWRPAQRCADRTMGRNEAHICRHRSRSNGLGFDRKFSQRGTQFMKNTVLRIAVAASMVAAGAVAHADVVLPSSGNGEIVLFVHDDTKGLSYARGIQVLVQDVLPGTSIVPTAGYTGPVQINYTLPTVQEDANLKSFLAATTAGAADSFSWALEGGAQLTGINTGYKPGANIYITTTQTDLTNASLNPSPVSNIFTVKYGSLNAALQTLNGAIGSGAMKDGSSTPAGADGIYGSGETSDPINWYGAGPFTASALGSSSRLYALTGNGTTTANAQVYYANLAVELTAGGVLEAVGAAPVPLPAAIWLLGSGLLGLTGIGRRRAAAASVPA